MSELKSALADLVTENEDWLMERILSYAKQCNYTKYTSTLIEAWRISIAGLSGALIDALQSDAGIPDLDPDEEFKNDPMAAFGVIAAQNHRRRGVSFGQFMGLMKYYRQSYIDLVSKADFSAADKDASRYQIDRFFDRVELSFSIEWLSLTEEKKLAELRDKNRQMTNEKNRYLTIFESLRDPIIFSDENGRIENLNHSALALFIDEMLPGATYYGKKMIGAELPWLGSEVREFIQADQDELEFERQLATPDGDRHYYIRFHKMLDRSDKFLGTVIMLTDISERERLRQEREHLINKLQTALVEVKTLRGIVPICMHCKKIRNEEGFWDQVEAYIQKHSEAAFSHGICEDCLTKLYPEHSDEIIAEYKKNIKEKP